MKQINKTNNKENKVVFSINKKKTHKFNRMKVISRTLYIISAILIISIIPANNKNFYSFFRQMKIRDGYTTENLYSSFINKEYSELYEKVLYNEGVGRKIEEDEEDYYAFSKCYNSAIDYYMYKHTNKQDKADDMLTAFKENESRLKERIFKDALESVKKTYEIQ